MSYQRESQMHPSTKTARIAGWLYLVTVIATPFLMIYVPSRLTVAGDASATMSRILANESLFRAQIVVGLFSELCFIGAIVALYRLLHEVDRYLSALMVLLIMLVVPLALLGSANELAMLTIVRGGKLLEVFDKPQRDAIAMLLINFDRYGVYVAELFWGLWLLPLGVLVRRSGFLPRWLGVWLVLNGVAYVILSFIGIAVPELASRALGYATPVLFGEAVLAVWLVVVGIRPTKSDAVSAKGTA